MPEPTGTFLAFDYGEHRIGVAVGERLTGSGRALETLRGNRAGGIDWTGIGRLIETWRPAGFVVGLPHHKDGTPSETTAAAARFGRRLEGRYRLPVHTIEELLSSIEADERLRTGQAPAHAGRDAVAAQVILESWFAEQGS